MISNYLLRFPAINIAVFTMISFAACSSSNPEPLPDPEPQPEPEPITDLEAAYFINSLQEKPLPNLGEARIISASDIETVSAELWNKWAAANTADTSYPLPAAVNLGGIDTYYPNPTGSWSVTGGNMRFVYGDKGAAHTDGYPLFIALHGSADDSYEEWGTTIAWSNYYTDAPSRYFIPCSPAGGTNCRWFQPSRQKAWEALIRKAFLDSKVNPDKIYFMGISEGAYGSQRLASFYADYLAGAGPIAGGEPSYNCPAENTANIAFCLQTGSEDTMYGRSRITKLAQDEWKKLAEEHPGYYTHKIDLQPDKGHGCDYTVTTPWLKNYSRNAQPKYVYWENFGMGNINGESYECRKGFYNLRVLEGQYGKTDGFLRDAYEMSITDNNIDLKVYSVTVTPDRQVSENGWTMNTGATRTKEPATKGKVRIYLSDKLVDLTKPVTVTVNGDKKYEGMPQLDRNTMVESIAFFYDPKRIFPTYIDVEI